MLSKPLLARCIDRNILPQQHPNSGAPEDWFSNVMLTKHELYGISFDFFVDWKVNPNELSPTIWIKSILQPQFNYDDVRANVGETLTTHFGQDYLRTLAIFGKENNLTVQFIIFRDDYDWANEKSELLIIDLLISPEEQVLFAYELVSIERFKELIRTNSGGPIQIGAKGLIYGTSNLECYLSHTDSLYPGDADLVILDKKCVVQCVLEFKKHTLDTSITLQKLSNYYPNPDGRKYNRLAILKDFLSLSKRVVPLFVVYYPTNKKFLHGKLELLEGSNGTLKTNIASNFLLPTAHDPRQFDDIVIKLVKAINFHFQNKES